MKSLTKLFSLLFISVFISLAFKTELYAQLKFKVSSAYTNLPGLTNAQIMAINDSGAVAGVSDAGIFINDAGKITMVPTLQGFKVGSLTYLLLNNKDEVGGTYDSTYFTPPDIYKNISKGFLYKDGKVMDIGTLGYSFTNVSDINDSGVLCGFSYLQPDGPIHAIIYQNGVLQDLGTLYGNSSNAEGINDKNWVVGSSYPPLSSSTIQDFNHRHEKIADLVGHAFIYKNGKMTDLGTLPGPQNYTWSYANAINDSGYVVGVNEYYDITKGVFFSAVVWNPLGVIQSLPALDSTTNSYALLINNNNLILGNCELTNGTDVPVVWDNGKVYNIDSLIEENSGYNVLPFKTSGINLYSQTVTVNTRMNNRDEIIAEATHNGQNVTVILKPVHGTIIKPDTNELVLANRRYEIKWENVFYKSLDVQFSMDDGATYKTIATGIPGSADSVSWNVPDTARAKCRIRLVDESNVTDTVESGRFKVKGYELTRLDANGEYQVFSPDKDGWQFPNDTLYMWPTYWWATQFDYSVAIDPYTHKHYPFWFVPTFKAHSWNFPDWPLWVEAYGVNQCYMNVNIPSYRADALVLWSNIRWLLNYNWQGSCEGFAVSSLLAFGNKDELLINYPEIGTFNHLAELKINDARRKLINLFWARQFSIESLTNSLEGKNKITPRKTLAELKKMFLSGTRDDEALHIFCRNPLNKRIISHAVTPYKLKRRVFFGVLYDVYIYDPDFPLDTNQFITIDSTSNSWFWNIGNKNKLVVMADTGLYLDIGDDNFFYHQTMSITDDISYPPVTGNYLELFGTPGANIIIKNDEGKEIGFTADSVINQFTDGVPIVPFSGDSVLPCGYFIPDVGYSIKTNNYPDSLAHLSIMSKDIIFSASREDAQNNQTDNYRFGNGFTVASNDNASKNFSLRMIVPVDSTEQLVTNIRNVSLNKYDSLKINSINNNEIKFVNYSNSGKTYDLGLWYASVNGQAMFNHDNIKIAANTTDEIVPNWQHLDSAKVLIRIDSGNNGSINDSIYIENHITSLGRPGGNSIPAQFILYQNYPNPFNPTTIIRFSIPKESNVRIDVYNIIGQHIKTLINENKSAGSYTVNFDGSDLPSGVYLYKIRAGNFIQTKKMILLK